MATNPTKSHFMIGNLEESSGDVVVCFSSYGMESGFGWFDEIHEKAGPELKQAVAKYRTLMIGSARVTPAFQLTNFKAILHIIVPDNIIASYENIDSIRFYNVFKNAFDLAIEQGYSSIVVGASVNYAEPAWTAQFMLRLLQDYPMESFYFDSIESIKLICSEEEYTYYCSTSADMAIGIEAPEPSSPTPAKRTRGRKRKLKPDDDSQEDFDPEETPARKTRKRRKNAGGQEHDPIPRDDLELMRSNGMYLMLSAKLEPSILNLKDETGKKRQYRLTNRSRDGHKLYFRCSRCDTLAKKDSSKVRARIIISNGEIINEEPPTHHPDCEPWTEEQLLVQQIDRSSRKTVKDGLLQPFEAYQNALYRITSTMGDSKMVEVPDFPDWATVTRRKKSVAASAAAADNASQEEAGVEGDLDVGYDDYIEPGDAEEAVEYVDPGPGPSSRETRTTAPDEDRNISVTD